MGAGRYEHLNAEFQRTASRDKKAFLRDQCREIEKNNRRGKTRDLFKKSGNIKGIFYQKMGTIRDRSGQDLVWKQKRPRRDGQEYTELYKKGLNDPNNHDGVFTHSEQDILKCEVK